MNSAEVMGIIAGSFTTIAEVPQIIKALKSKKVDNVSPWMFCVMILGVFLWTVYGFMKMDYPIIVTNGISVLLNFTMLMPIFKYRG